MNRLTLTTCLGENTEPVCKAVSNYLSAHLEIAVQYEGEIPWQERSRRLDTGEIEIGWICGLLYVQKVDETASIPSGGQAVSLSPLVAPIMIGEEYQQQPIYTSKIIVHRDSNFRSFSDLRGMRFGINEPNSYSGCVLLQAHLAKLGENGSYFSELVETSSHSESMKQVVNGRIDAAAIDCTIYNYFIPQLEKNLRIVKQLGPSPIPLWVISNKVPPAQRKKIRQLLLNMGNRQDGRDMLATGNVARFTTVQDSDYDPIRQMNRLASSINFHMI